VVDSSAGNPSGEKGRTIRIDEKRERERERGGGRERAQEVEMEEEKVE